jgi:hypothetical protein
LGSSLQILIANPSSLLENSPFHFNKFQTTRPETMMATTNSNPHEELKKATARLIGSNRFIFGFLSSSMLFMFVFGPWIYVIAVGLLWGGWTVSMFFNAPYQLIIRIFRLEDMPRHSPKPNSSAMIYTLVNLLVAAYLVYISIKALVFFGFDLFSPLLAIVDAIPLMYSD